MSKETGHFGAVFAQSFENNALLSVSNNDYAATYAQKGEEFKSTQSTVLQSDDQLREQYTYCTYTFMCHSKILYSSFGVPPSTIDTWLKY